MVTTTFIASMRDRLRISNTRSDAELTSLVESARVELVLAGCNPRKAANESDDFITTAIVTYIKAEYGLDAPDAEKYRAAFEKMKVKAALSQSYGGE